MGTTMAAFLLTLISGTFLLAWISKQEVCCKKLVKGVSFFVMTVSLLGVICTAYMMCQHCKGAERKCPLNEMQHHDSDMDNMHEDENKTVE